MPTLTEAFEILDPVSTHTCGTLYRARDRVTNALCLVVRASEEISADEALKRLRRDGAVAVAVHAAGRTGQGVQRVLSLVGDGYGEALVLGYFPGPSLETFQGRSLPPEEFLPLALALCRSVEQVHRAGFVHLNISPSSFLWDPAAGEVLLVDFSQAVPAEYQNDPLVSDWGDRWDFVSPEQTGRLRFRADWRSDYYSLGMLFYTLVTGRPAFEGLGRVESIHAHLAQVPDRPPVPAPLADLILKLLEKNPEKRYQSMTGLAADLERCRVDWSVHQRFLPFELGTQDNADRFQISQELFGREKEKAALEEVYRSVCAGGRGIVMVAGPSGIGKSQLILEAGSWAVRDKGLFLQGKHDAAGREQPYSALIQCFESLVTQLLHRSDRDRWRQSLEKGLGGNLPVLASLVPSLRELVGAQPAPPVLPPKETESRFLFSISAFLKIIAAQQSPLVLFLDDFQWMDPASFRVLEYLAEQEEPRRFLVLLASREVHGTDHKRLTTQPVLTLGPLTEADVSHLVSASLGRTVRPVKNLARLLWGRTRGNHFFVHHLFHRIQQDGILFYHWEHRAWDWDDLALEGLPFSENVYDLLINDFRKLSPPSRFCLGVAACLGTVIRVADLDFFSGLLADPAGALVPLLERRYLTVHSGEYIFYGGNKNLSPQLVLQFQHDRIKQAALDQLDPADREKFQLILARGLLQKRNAAPEFADRLGETAALFAPFLNRLTDPEEKLRLVELFFDAAEQARSRSARDQAHDFYQKALTLIDEVGGAETQRRKIQLRLAEMLYLTGKPAEADALAEGLKAKIKDPLEQAEVAIMQMDVLSFLGQHPRAIDLGLEALRRSGFPVPRDPGAWTVAGELVPLLIRASLVSTDKLLSRRTGISAKNLTLLRLLGSLQVPANLSKNSNFPILLILKAAGLALNNGNNPESAQAFGHWALLMAALGKPQEAFRFGTLALELSERFPDPKTQAHVHNVYSLYCLPWNRPWSEHRPASQKAAALGFESGDQFTYGYETGFAIQFNYDVPLGLLIEDGEKALKTIANIGLRGAWVGLKLAVQKWRFLAGKLEGPPGLSDREFHYEDTMAQWRSEGITTGLGVGYINLLCLQVLMGEYEPALKTWAQLESVLNAVAGSAYAADACIYSFMLYSHWADSKGQTLPNGLTKKLIRQRMARERRRMAVWARSCPSNFAHWKALMEAEEGAAAGRTAWSARRFDRAMVLVEATSSLRDKAVIHERAALFHLHQGHKKIGTYLMREAFSWYDQWGAARKTDQLLAQFADLGLVRRSLVKGSGPGNLGDMTSVLKVTQALSKETDLERLQSAVLLTVVESAGAQAGWLLLKSQSESGQWEVGAKCDSSGQASVFSSHYRAEGVPEKILFAALERKEGVIIADALADPVYADDPLVQQRGVRSVLCLPFSPPGGRPMGIWYLENNLIPGAFPDGRRDVLATLSAQVSASLENARNFRALAALNKNLEAKVQERTAELEEKNRHFMASVEYAAVLQRSLLPTAFGSGIADSFVYFAPRDLVGGDTYWFQESSQGSLLILADCTGHGVPGALISVMLHSLIDDVVKDADPADLAAVIRNLNQRFRRSFGLNRSGEDADDGFDIGVCWWDSRSPVLRFAGAQIGLFVVRDGQTVYYPGARQSLGYARSPDEPPVQVMEIPVSPGMEAVLATDGMGGQIGGPSGISYGRERFSQLLKTVSPLPGKEKAEKIAGALGEYRGNRPQLDDVTVIGLRWKD